MAENEVKVLENIDFDDDIDIVFDDNDMSTDVEFEERIEERKVVVTKLN